MKENHALSEIMHEPRLQSEPRGGVPDVIDTVEGFNDACDELAAASGSLAADAERASMGMRIGWCSSNAGGRESSCSTRSR